MDRIDEGSDDSLQEKLEGYMEDPEFADMVREFRDVLVSLPDNLSNEDNIRFDSCVQKILDSHLNHENSNEFLAMFHRVVSGRILGDLVKLFESDEFAQIFSTLGEKCYQGVDVSDEFRNSLKAFNNKLVNLIRVLQNVGFDRAELSDRSPFSPPFDNIDIKDPNWVVNLEVAENFCHALKNIFNAQGFLMKIRTLSRLMKDGKIEDAKEVYTDLEDYFLKTLPSVLPIFKYFRDKLFAKDTKEKVDVSDLVEAVEILPVARFGLKKEMKKFPVEVQAQEEISLENSDGNALITAFWELMKNAFRDDKVSTEELKAFLEIGESYLKVNAGKALLNGEEVVVVEISDRGTPINVSAVVEKLKNVLVGWKSRDITFGEMLDTLSQRHLSIPLEGGKGQISTGIGLHSARSIIQDHNGEMFPVNLEDGVSFLIVLPVDGKNSKWKVSDVKVTGAQCGELSKVVSIGQAGVRGGVASVVGGVNDEEEYAVAA